MCVSLPCDLLISQHLSIELEFSVMLGDVAGGVGNGWLGQQFSVCVWSLLADCRVDVVSNGRMVVFVQCDQYCLPCDIVGVF